MRNWFKMIILPVVIVGIMFMAIGSSDANAAKPTNDPVGCLPTPSLNELSTVTGFHGKTGESVIFDFCGDNDLDMIITLTWSKTRNDLELTVTEPSGAINVIDWHAGRLEVFQQRAPVEQGTWTVDVANNGNGKVAYGLSIVFVH